MMRTLVFACTYRHAQQLAREAELPWSRALFVAGPETLRSLEHGTRGMPRLIASCLDDRGNARQIRDALASSDMWQVPSGAV